MDNCSKTELSYAGNKTTNVPLKDNNRKIEWSKSSNESESV